MKHTLVLLMVLLLSAAGLRAQGCGSVNAPWWADFSSDSSFSCWASYGDAVWTRNASGSNYRLRVQFNGAAGGNTGRLLSQPIVLPADSTGLKFFWSENRGNNTFGTDSLKSVPFSSQGEGKYVLDLTCLPQGHYLLTVVIANGKRHHLRLTKQQ